MSVWLSVSGETRASLAEGSGPTACAASMLMREGAGPASMLMELAGDSRRPAGMVSGRAALQDGEESAGVRKCLTKQGAEQARMPWQA